MPIDSLRQEPVHAGRMYDGQLQREPLRHPHGSAQPLDRSLRPRARLQPLRDFRKRSDAAGPVERGRLSHVLRRQVPRRAGSDLSLSGLPQRGRWRGHAKSRRDGGPAIEWIEESDDETVLPLLLHADPHRAGARGFANPKSGESLYPGIRRKRSRPAKCLFRRGCRITPDSRDELKSITRRSRGSIRGSGPCSTTSSSSGLAKNTLVLSSPTTVRRSPARRRTCTRPG